MAKSRSAGCPRRASGLQCWACPTAGQAPIGAIPPQSPGGVALQGRPNPGLGSPHAKKPYRGGATPNRHANPNGRASPYRGDPSPKPRVRSPARVTKPWVSQPPCKEALQGRPLKRPWCASWRPLWGRRPFALLEGRACRCIDRYSSAVPHSAQPRGRQGATPSF